MFTTIGNILGTTQPRHAEQSDTRQDIQRHDPEFERRKKKKQKSDDDLFAHEDGATVSVTALQTFLNTFLKELNDKKPKQGFNTTSNASLEKEQPDGKDTPIEPQPDKKPLSGHAAYATNAYQHIAESGKNRSILGEVNESNADLISLDGSEVRTIHALLDDLQQLTDKNIEYIRIERAETFLQSLVNAVKIVKKSDLFKT